MPEEQLRAYLRIFLTEDRIEPVLDEVALMGLEIEADDEIELFVLAHIEVSQDPRVTEDLEAAVLVAEVGLDEDMVAAILDLTVDEVRVAVARAWSGDDREATDATFDLTPDDLPPDALTPDDPVAAGDPAGGEVDLGAGHVGPAEVPAADGRRVGGGTVVGGVLLVAIAALAVIVLTDAGRARLTLQGIDPVVAIGVVFGLVLGGLAFLRAAESSAEQPPAAGQQQHEADEHG